MPQMHLNPREDLIALSVELVDRTPDLIDGFDVTIRLRRRDDEYRTVYSARWSGYMTDYFDVLYERVAHAWLYGDARDVQRAAQRTQVDARRHHRTHEQIV